MRIGVDCDGVLTDLSAYYYEYGEKYFKRQPEDPAACGISEMFGCTKRAELFFGIRYFITYCKKWPPRTNAVKVINELADRGHELYEITARKFVTMRGPLGFYSRYLYEKWLTENGFPFQDIFYCSESRAPEDKLQGCKRYSVDLMIDDRPEVAGYLAAQGIRVLLFNTEYNQGIDHVNIIRVEDWNDIDTVIAGQEKNNIDFFGAK